MKRSPTFLFSFITIISILALAGCGEISPKTTNNLLKTVTLEQIAPVEKSDSKTETQATQEEDSNLKPILKSDPIDFSKNFYKYQDFSITFEPKKTAAEIIRGEEYDVVLSQKGKKQVLFKDESVGMYDSIMEIALTKDPYILEFRSGFGDAGYFSLNQEFVNIKNSKYLLINLDSNDEMDKQNPSFTINKHIFSLFNTKNKESCTKDEQRESIFKDNKPVVKLNKPLTFICRNGELDHINAGFSVTAVSKNLDKIYIQLKQISDQSDENSKVTAIFEITPENGNLTLVKDPTLEKDNIYSPVDVY